MAALCKICGSNLSDSGRFCSECGASQKENNIARRDEISDIIFSGESQQFHLDILPGEKVFNNRFTIRSYIGSGGFSEVYLAMDTDADHEVALKIVPSIEGNVKKVAEQLRNEINLRRGISNFTHITMVNDIYVDSDYKGLSLVLLSMEHASQGSLRDWLKENSASIKQDNKLSEALHYFEEVCLGVKEIHSAGLMHLDLKPENILLVDGKAKVSDLGLSCNYIQYSQNKKNAAARYGTPAYMSPEQFKSARKKDIGYLSDIYSLGVILFELVDGSVPFDGTYDELKEKHLNFTPPSLDGLRVPWSKIVDRCLNKKPSLRYRSTDELLSDLIRAKTGSVLSEDFACKCGHVNTNPDLRQCQKCKSDISHFFHRCPSCQKYNRLDVEVCPIDNLGCGYEVGRHFRVEDLLSKARTYQDSDLLEAIKCLAEVLRLDRGNGKAKKLLPGLRNLQEKVDVIILDAETAEKEGLLEHAREKWQEVLSLVNRHPLAVKKKKGLDKQISRFHESYDKAFVLMSQGAFPQAYECLNECQKIIPTRKETKAAIKELNAREQHYNHNYEEATTEIRLKNLNAGREKLEICLSVAPESAEVKKLISGIDDDMSRSAKFFQLANESILKAEFKEAKDATENTRSIHNDYNGIDEFERELDEKERHYNIFVKDCDLALNADKRDLNKAVISLEKALNICPKAKSSEKLLQSILNDKERSLKLISESKLNITAANFRKAEALLQEASMLWLKAPELAETKIILREARKKYEDYVKKAIDCHKNKKDLQPALDYSTSALEVCNKSEKVKSMVNQITKDMKKVTEMLDQVAADTQSAAFSDAEDKLKVISDIWANVPRLEEMKSDCKAREKEYKIYYSEALDSYNKKDLELALKSADKALKVCSSSFELIEIRKKIYEDMANATKIFAKISPLISSALFSEAKTNVNLIKNVWPSFPDIGETTNNIKIIENKYNNFYEAAKISLYDKKAPISARDNIDSALDVCPNSTDAKILRDQINNEIEETERRKKKSIQSATQFMQVAVVSLISVAIIYFIVWPIITFVWGIISWIFQNIIMPILSGIGLTISWIFESIIWPILSGIVDIIRSIFNIFSK